MKHFAHFLPLVLLAGACVPMGVSPASAQRENRSIGENQVEAKRAAKQQNKVNKKLAKQHQKAMKKYLKAQKKATKRQTRRTK